MGVEGRERLSQVSNGLCSFLNVPLFTIVVTAILFCQKLSSCSGICAITHSFEVHIIYILFGRLTAYGKPKVGYPQHPPSLVPPVLLFLRTPM